jgi:four helix bundle protein
MSVAANYRAAGRGRSRPEFIAKLGIVIEETDEAVLWLELLREGEIVTSGQLQPLLDEAEQLLRVFVASRRTARRSV